MRAELGYSVNHPHDKEQPSNCINQLAASANLKERKSGNKRHILGPFFCPNQMTSTCNSFVRWNVQSGRMTREEETHTYLVREGIDMVPYEHCKARKPHVLYAVLVSRI
jgi:hypothetical protein